MNITQLYQRHKAGKISQLNFITEVFRTPGIKQYVNPAMSAQDVLKVLRQRHLIVEDQRLLDPKTDKSVYVTFFKAGFDESSDTEHYVVNYVFHGVQRTLPEKIVKSYAQAEYTRFQKATNGYTFEEYVNEFFDVKDLEKLFTKLYGMGRLDNYPPVSDAEEIPSDQLNAKSLLIVNP